MIRSQSSVKEIQETRFEAQEDGLLNDRYARKDGLPAMVLAQETKPGTTPSSIGSIPAPLIVSSGMVNATLAEVAHEARNMVAALGLYCEFLEEPGVFAAPYQHYGTELKMVATASRALVDRLLALSAVQNPDAPPKTGIAPADAALAEPSPLMTHSKAASYWQELPPSPVNDLAWELQMNRNLLAALAGPSVLLTIDSLGGGQPVSMSGEDLTRILVNLVKNSVEAMPSSGGHIQLILRECQASSEEKRHLLLNIEDNGVGFSSEALEHIFETGYTTRSTTAAADQMPRAEHRGLGLSITRAIVETAGGHIRAANRDPVGACIQIELPVRAI